MKIRNSSSQVASLIAPVHGCRDALRRKGIEPKDFHKQNLKQLKSLQIIPKPVTKPAVRTQSIPAGQKNYVTGNVEYVKSLKIPNFEEPETSICYENIGKVPEYINTIKKTLAVDKEKQ